MPRVCWEDCIIFLQICRNTMQSSHLPRKHEVVHHHVAYLYPEICIYADTAMLLCLHNILAPFSVYVKSTTSSSWGISFSCYGQANTYTRHSTNAVSMLGQRRCGWPIIEKLTAPTIFIVFVGYKASGSGYPGGVGDEILLL